MKVHSIVVFCFALLVYLSSFCYLFLLFHFYILFKHILNHTKFLQLKFDLVVCVHMGMRFHQYISSPSFVFLCSPNCAYLISNCCFSTLFKT